MGGAISHKGCGRAGAYTVIHVDDREARGATLKHPEYGGSAVSAETVAGRGRQPHHWDCYEARDHGRKRALHPSRDDQAVRIEGVYVLKRSGEAVNASDADIMKALHYDAHLAGDCYGLLQDRQVRGTGAYGDDAAASLFGGARAGD